jgi:hypothetical protein
VKVKYLQYAQTMQESCLRLMGKKLLASLAMEGKFSSEGLQAINDEDDILMAMARELVAEKGIGKRADAVWAGLQKKQEEVFAVKSAQAEAPVAEPTQEASVVARESSVTAAPQWLSLGASLESTRRKTSRRVGSREVQLTLF